MVHGATSAGVAHLCVQREADVSNLGDLLLYSLDDLEESAVQQGGIRQLLDEKWRKVYKASEPWGSSHQQSFELRSNCTKSDLYL